MIINFSIFEKLGYNEEVSKLAEHVWKLYKSGEREIDLSQYSQDNMSIFINKLFLEEYYLKRPPYMSAMYNRNLYEKSKSFKITINKYYKQTIMSLEHELKHMYDFVKCDGDYKKMKDKSIIGPFSQLSTEDENIKKFFYIMYIIDMNEVEAYFHSDIRNFKENKHKFKNDIRQYIKYSRLQYNLKYINDNNIKDILSEVDINDLNTIMNYYYEIANNKLYDLKGFAFKFERFKKKIEIFLQNISILPENYKVYSDKEIDNFYEKFEKEIEKKKKIYLKYIGRLYSYFN